MTTTHTATTTNTTPSPEQVTALLVYLFDHVQDKVVESALDQRSGPNIRTVSGHGIEHPYFATRRSLLFYDSGLIPVATGRRECARLVLLSDTSWLLWRYRMGTWNTEPIAPPTMHYYTAELRPVFEELEVHGATAIKGIRHVLRLLNPQVRWSVSWEGLLRQVKQQYRILV